MILKTQIVGTQTGGNLSPSVLPMDTSHCGPEIYWFQRIMGPVFDHN